jgi:hypothetical protein
MKTILWAICALMLISLAYLGLQTAAAERVEVVALYTINSAGEENVTRLWIVDYDGYSYIRAGDPRSNWFQDLQENSYIKLTRGETTASFTASADVNVKMKVNALMQEKYTWGETFIGAVFSRENSIPIRLTVLPGATKLSSNY